MAFLLAEEKMPYKDDRYTVWRCYCTNCSGKVFVNIRRRGNEVNISTDGLIHMCYQSCGCLRKEIEQNIGSTLQRVDNTCIEFLVKCKHWSDNTDMILPK